jgi:hypothetical protein
MRRPSADRVGGEKASVSKRRNGPLKGGPFRVAATSQAHGAFVASQRPRATTESGFDASTLTVVPVHLPLDSRPTT